MSSIVDSSDSRYRVDNNSPISFVIVIEVVVRLLDIPAAIRSGNRRVRSARISTHFSSSNNSTDCARPNENAIRSSDPVAEV